MTPKILLAMPNTPHLTTTTGLVDETLGLILHKNICCYPDESQPQAQQNKHFNQYDSPKISIYMV